MPQVCLYLQLHQPFRLTDLHILDIGEPETSYFAREQSDHNRDIFTKVANKSYIPMLQLLKKKLETQSELRFALSMSGVFVEQAQRHRPEVIALIQDLVGTGRVELLAETYYHSLSFLYSETEFRHQVAEHTQLMNSVFGVTPEVFRNTELIYSNHIASMVASMGFQGMLTEAVDRYLHGRKHTQLFVSATETKLPLLLKHYQLSDDIAFRFSEKSWQWYPLTVDQYSHWIASYNQEEIINLFMDFETFGEHQWEDTGIFEFFSHWVDQFLTSDYNSFKTPTQLFVTWNNSPSSAETPTYDVPEPISWADIDRDLTAWRDNDLQYDSLRVLYQLEDRIAQLQNPEITSLWRKLQTSDHFYYMCTKWFADGDVHAYFSPYDSPFEAYRHYAIALADLKGRIDQAVSHDTVRINARATT